MLFLLVVLAIILLLLALLGALLHFLAVPVLYILLVVGVSLLIIWLVQRVKGLGAGKANENR